MSEVLRAEFSRLADLRVEMLKVQTECHRNLMAHLTRRNFFDMLREHYHKIAPDRSLLRISYTGFDWHEDDIRNACVISFDADLRDVPVILDYVRTLWPHALIYQDSATNALVALVSKSRCLAATLEQLSLRDEDNVGNGLQLLEFVLYHGIDLPYIREWLAYQLCCRGIVISGDDPATRRAQSKQAAAAIRTHDARAMMDGIWSIWMSQYRASMWCNLHDRLLELGLALAPLCLTPYELLWILDCLQPMDFHCYRDGVPYDPNHTLKLRLFESVAESYRKIKMG
jgi:hypothetical protein